MSRIIDFFLSRPLLLAGFVITLVISVFALPNYLYTHHTGGTLTAVVENKERVCDGGQDGTCRWMVMTPEMAFVNTDSFWHLKFDSTDVQGQVRIGETHTVTYYGWRIPFLSVYPNIIKVD